MLRLINTLVEKDQDTGKQILEEQFQSGVLNSTEDALNFLHYAILHPRVSSVLSISVQEWKKDGSCSEDEPVDCSKAKALQTLESLVNRENLYRVSIQVLLSGVPSTVIAQFERDSEGMLSYFLSHAGHVNSAAFMQEVEQAAIKKNTEPMLQVKEQAKKRNLIAWLFGLK